MRKLEIKDSKLSPKRNISRLRIVSRDKINKKKISGNKFKIHISKEKKSNKASRRKLRAPKKNELYLQLEKLINKRSRSIDVQQDESSSKQRRKKNKHLSEDKNTQKYLMCDQPNYITKNLLVEKKNKVNASPKVVKQVSPHENNFYFNEL